LKYQSSVCLLLLIKVRFQLQHTNSKISYVGLPIICEGLLGYEIPHCMEHRRWWGFCLALC